MSHFSFFKAIRGIANGNWGLSDNSKEDVERHLVENPEKMAAFAIADMLRRLYAAFEPSRDELRELHYSHLTRSEGARKGDGLKIGDVIFEADMECGVSSRIVVGHDSDGFPVTLYTIESDEDLRARPFYVYGEPCTSQVEALRRAALSDIRYHKPRLEWAQQCIEAIESGGDLTRFIKGNSDAMDELENEE